MNSRCALSVRSIARPAHTISPPAHNCMLTLPSSLMFFACIHISHSSQGCHATFLAGMWQLHNPPRGGRPALSSPSAHSVGNQFGRRLRSSAVRHALQGSPQPADMSSTSAPGMDTCICDGSQSGSVDNRGISPAVLLMPLPGEKGR